MQLSSNKYNEEDHPIVSDDYEPLSEFTGP